jgi:uridine kinase
MGTDFTKEDAGVFHLDNFYRPIKEVLRIQGIDERDPEAISKVNWDDPNLIDYEKLIEKLKELINTGQTTVQKYDKATGDYSSEIELIIARRVVLVESFLLFSAGIELTGTYSSGKQKVSVLLDQNKTAQEILELIPYRVYVHCDENVAWSRRLARDAHQVPRTYEQTNILWERDTIPGAIQYIYPIRQQGIFNREINNTVLNVMDIDSVFMSIAYSAGANLNQCFGCDPAPREELICARYEEKTREEAKWLRELFNRKNGSNPK